MRRICLIIFLFPASLFGQSNLSGRVLDNKGEAIPGATVSIAELNKGTVTDLDGRFSFSEVTHDDYTLIIRSVGFESSKLEIAHPSAPIRISLSSNIKELEAVVVSTDRETQEKKLTGYNVSTISVEKFHDLNVDVNRILGTMVGVNIREKGGLGSGFELSLNGLSGNQVRYFMDEVPMEFYGSSLTLNNIPANLIQSIEVYKGVTPVSLTSDALGGAVNITTSNYKESLLDVSYAIGSFNTHRASLIAQHATDNNFHFRFMSFVNHSDNNYKMKHVPVTDEFGNILGEQEAERFHDAYKSGSITGEVGLSNKSFADDLTLGVTFAGNRNEVQHTEVSINRVYGGLITENRSLIGTAKYSKKWGNFEWKNNAMVGWVEETFIDTLTKRFNWLGESRDIETAEYFNAPSISILEDRFRWFRSGFNYQFNKEHKVSGQLSSNHLNRDGRDELNPLITARYTPNYLTKQFAGLSYAYNSASGLLKTSLFAKQYWYKAEIHTEEYVGDGTEIVQNSTSFSKSGYGAALSYFLNKNWLVKSSYEFAYRLPEAFEIMGDGLLTLPSPNLQPENSHNINLGLIHNRSFLNSSIKSEWNVFYRPTKDKIWRVAQGVLSTYRNIASTRILGIETSNSITINAYTFSMNLTYQSNTDQREFNEGLPNANYGERMPNDPYFFGDAGIQYRFSKSGMQFTTLWNTRYVHEFYLYAESNGNRANKRSIPTQWVNDLNLNCIFAGGKYGASVSINNIFNEEAYDNWSLQKPGRSFNLKLRYFISKS